MNCGAKKASKMYMNLATGSVDDYDGWWYTDENGHQKNAVDENEVVEVTWDEEEEMWVEKWPEKWIQ